MMHLIAGTRAAALVLHAALCQNNSFYSPAAPAAMQRLISIFLLLVVLLHLCVWPQACAPRHAERSSTGRAMESDDNGTHLPLGEPESLAASQLRWLGVAKASDRSLLLSSCASSLPAEPRVARPHTPTRFRLRIFTLHTQHIRLQI